MSPETSFNFLSGGSQNTDLRGEGEREKKLQKDAFEEKGDPDQVIRISASRKKLLQPNKKEPLKTGFRLLEKWNDIGAS